MSERETILGWFIGRIDDTWFEGTPDLTYDRDEIVVVGVLAEPTLDPETTEEVRAEARRSRIQAFRQKTRSGRIDIARSAEHTFDRKVSWGATCGSQTEMFTTLAVPAMTRLRMPERKVLDTLVASGVAKSRSEALSWCVRLVGTHESDWLSELESAMRHVDEVKQRGPG
ncbi:MAG: hypothetical protein ACFCVC_13110 [Acidimicrobiia bacterium]